MIRIANLWVEFFIKEALQCYNAKCMEVAVIMLGLSSEKIIEEQIDALLGYLSRNFRSCRQIYLKLVTPL